MFSKQFLSTPQRPLYVGGRLGRGENERARGTMVRRKRGPRLPIVRIHCGGERNSSLLSQSLLALQPFGAFSLLILYPWLFYSFIFLVLITYNHYSGQCYSHFNLDA